MEYLYLQLDQIFRRIFLANQASLAAVQAFALPKQS